MKKIKNLLFLLFISANVWAQNPAASGFDITGSDTKAIDIADKVMQAIGGRKNWDKTRYITWVFFGNRRHYWDKWTGDVRVEGMKDKSVSIINVNTEKGIIYKNRALITQPDSLLKYIKSAKAQWINDSYWLLQPFKLKDSGVTLKYLGDGKTQDNEEADLLGLTFKEVGNTPQNKYQLWVTKKDNLVKQWSYYAKADNEKPNFTLPWINYKKYGNILISGDRGERKLTDIQVFKKIDKQLFKDPTFIISNY